MRSSRNILVASLALWLCTACESTTPGPYQPPGELVRNTTRAEQLTRKAANLIYEEPDGAEDLLREALTEDIFYGPAHNNLGVVFLERGDLYEAAHEFEWARKLMPGHPDTRVNLALVMEQAGKNADALESYEGALEVRPGYLAAVQGIACLTLRLGLEDERLPEWLDAIALSADSDEWQSWAGNRRVRERLND